MTEYQYFLLLPDFVTMCMCMCTLARTNTVQKKTSQKNDQADRPTPSSGLIVTGIRTIFYRGLMEICPLLDQMFSSPMHTV